MCRILKTAGHKVILADLCKFRFSAARFSSSVDKWVTLPNVDGSDTSVASYKVTNSSESTKFDGTFFLLTFWAGRLLAQPDAFHTFFLCLKQCFTLFFLLVSYYNQNIPE